MECGEDCGCGAACQNQRFQQRQYANVAVIKTEKKGYGLRTDSDLKPGDFIFEYIGEVIGENAFRKRMQNYDEEGIKHFYFMSLTKGEFVDATKRGNLGRFCNHSCNPNCYVDKWVVGDKLRMGIFAERKIQAGEELVFNYNVDRYGAEPQPCYCGEPNCTGYIGGKTQTERATKLSNTIIEALGIDDADAWDTAVAKKPRKKKASEDDEEYVNNVEPRGLDEDGVNKVMSSLMQCKEKWIAVKLLSRVQRADDEKVRNRVVRFHGYRILKTVLSNFVDDVNVCLQVFDVLEKMPRITRNKINDSKIEETVQPLTENEDERVSTQAKALMEAWSKLEVGYRIPRMKRDPNAAVPDRKVERVDRRGDERRKSRSKSPAPIKAPTGPKGNAPQRKVGFRPPNRFMAPPPPEPLPFGWREATTQGGGLYYWNDAGQTTWERPSAPAPGAPPPPPSKAQQEKMMLEELIKNITKKEPAKQPSATTTPAETPKKQSKEDKWRSWPEDQQRKTYEKTIAPHILQVANKSFGRKMSKEDFKRLTKDLVKSVASSDYRKGRVENPTKLSDKQTKALKKHTYEYFDKFVKKIEAKKAERKAKSKSQPAESHTPEGSPPPAVEEEMDVEMSDGEGDVDVADMTPAESSKSPTALKRRREEDTVNGMDDEQSLKKMRADLDEEDTVAGAQAPPPPPPPPPPPATGEPIYGTEFDMEDSTLSPNEDVSGSFTHEAIAAVHEAAMEEHAQANGDSSAKSLTINGRPGSAQAFDKSDVTQTATPPTTGSPDIEDAEKVAKRQTFAGMNPDRMRQLGLYDGAAD